MYTDNIVLFVEHCRFYCVKSTTCRPTTTRITKHLLCWTSKLGIKVEHFSVTLMSHTTNLLMRWRRKYVFMGYSTVMNCTHWLKMLTPFYISAIEMLHMTLLINVISNCCHFYVNVYLRLHMWNNSIMQSSCAAIWQCKQKKSIVCR